MNMIGNWESWYSGVEEPQAYGDTKSYEMAAEIFDGMFVQDWGTGKGFFPQLYGTDLVYAIDGTETPWTDDIVDLTEYTSTTPGILLRHVIEHNFEWSKILKNAEQSFTKTLVLILFTPMARKTRQIAWNAGVEVPDISFSPKDIEAHFPDCDISFKDIRSNTQYGHERIYTIRKVRS